MLRQLRSIQVLRGLAACAVVALHASGMAFVRGAAGVDLFFVISGFIMASIPKRSTFLFDRAWRIFPLWWVAALPWLLWNEPVRGFVDPLTVTATITLLPVALPALSVGWTLSFELLFYCAVALAAKVGIMPLLTIFALMLAGAVLTRAPPFTFLGNPMIFEFLFGAMIAVLPRVRWLALPLLVFAIVCFAFAPTWIYPPEFAMRAPASAWRVLYWGVPAAMIVYAAVSLEGGRRGRSPEPLPSVAADASQRTRPGLSTLSYILTETRLGQRVIGFFVLLGNASYSIYLFHLTAMRLVTLPRPLEFALGVSTGVIGWWTIERPILALKPKLRPVQLLG